MYIVSKRKNVTILGKNQHLRWEGVCFNRGLVVSHFFAGRMDGNDIDMVILFLRILIGSSNEPARDVSLELEI